MARKRMIDPDFWIDENLGTCSRDARLLFIATWNFADDKGRLLGNPDRLKVEVFPYDQDVTPSIIALWLGELESVGCIKSYIVDRKSLIWIPKFLTHQIINRPSKKCLPPHPDETGEGSGTFNESSVRTHSQNNNKQTEHEQEHEGEEKTTTCVSTDSVSVVVDDTCVLSLCSLYSRLNAPRYPTAKCRILNQEFMGRPDWDEGLAIQAMSACHSQAVEREGEYWRANSLKYYATAIAEALIAGKLPSKNGGRRNVDKPVRI